MKKTNYAVIGRIPYDDEDSVFCYEGVTEDEARTQFVEDIIRKSGRSREKWMEMLGADFHPYINNLLASESPINCS